VGERRRRFLATPGSQQAWCKLPPLLQAGPYNNMHARAETAAAEPQLDVRAVHLWRGERHLLRGTSFVLERGELLQVVGPNGVGKTSLLRCVAGLLPMESGEIVWRGRQLRECRDDYHQQLAYLAHINALKADLTALENLQYSVALRRPVMSQELRATFARLQIAQCADLPARALSAGQKRRVAIGRILLTRAELWILDEPITNLDSAGIALFEECMAEHLRTGGMILTAAHQLLLQGQPGVRTLELH
jgi:heme exporter protein A